MSERYDYDEDIIFERETGTIIRPIEITTRLNEHAQQLAARDAEILRLQGELDAAKRNLKLVGDANLIQQRDIDSLRETVRMARGLTAERDQHAKAATELVELFKRQSIRSFVSGAMWWEFEKTGVTMWASDRDKVWVHASERFPFVNVDHRENDDVLQRYAEVSASYLEVKA